MAADRAPRTVVLVHGAWHGAWCWSALQAELDRRGIASLAVDLPGHGASLLPFGDLHGDAAHVASVLARVPGEVVLVGHSYGGAVITEAAARSANVAHLVYLTAFCLDEGETVIGVVQSLPAAPTVLGGAIRPAAEEGLTVVDPELAPAAFYASCSLEVATAATARLCPQPMAAFVQPVTAAPWRTTPSTYVVCTKDEAIHPSHQEHMAGRCGRVERLDTDHSPFASMPGEVAGIVEPLARA